MELAVSSFRLQGLPAHVIASHIMPLLDLRDLVALDRARAVDADGMLSEVQNLMPPLKLLQGLENSVVLWLLEHGYHLCGSELLFSESTKAAELWQIMEQFSDQFHDLNISLPNKHLKGGKVISRCSKICLTAPLDSDQFVGAGMHALNVTDLTLSREVTTAFPALVSQLLQVLPKLNKLICSCKSFMDALPALKCIGTTMKELRLSEFNASINPELFVEAAALCSYLERIGIIGFSASETGLSADAIILAFAERCRNLKAVSVDFCHFSTAALRQLLRNCRNLTSIDGLRGQWSAADTLTVAECGARLRTLVLEHALLGTLETYATIFAHLQSVELGPTFLVSASAAAAVSCMPALQSVEIRCARRAGAVNTSAVLRAIGGTCRQLRRLCCTGNYKMDVRFANSLALVLTNNSQFRSVRLSCHSVSRCVGTRMPQILVDALAQCRTLEELALGCYNVADLQMQAIVASTRYLNCCVVPVATELRDVFLSALAQHCRHLSQLNVSRSTHLTEGALVQLTQRCPRLTDLVVHCNSMSSATAAALNCSKRLYALTVTTVTS
jgi:hypothetical protein